MRDLKGPCLLNHGVPCVWIVVFFSRQHVKHTAGVPSVVSPSRTQFRTTSTVRLGQMGPPTDCVYMNVLTTEQHRSRSAASLVSVLGCSFTLALLLSPLHCLNHRHLLGLLLLVPGLILQPGNTRDGMMRTC